MYSFVVSSEPLSERIILGRLPLQNFQVFFVGLVLYCLVITYLHLAKQNTLGTFIHVNLIKLCVCTYLIFVQHRCKIKLTQVNLSQCFRINETHFFVKAKCFEYCIEFCEHFTCLSSKIQNAIKLENISNLITSPSSYQCIRRKTRLVYFVIHGRHISMNGMYVTVRTGDPQM